ncbi:hypothetical protein QZH41_000436 [Actinostola sp. cb2023]|nr:hypothetical protein QZH41_000436 [Actinostola sp. cb2023]
MDDQELGYCGRPTPQSYPNHTSALEASDHIIKELTRELNLTRMAGPYLTPPTPHFVGSPMGAVPKKRSNPLKYHIIHDLSWPRDKSVNDFIPAERFQCYYDTLDRAISLVKQAGTGAYMAKLDLPDAYRHILVRPADWDLLGSTWPIYVDGELKTGYFLNMFLPFGARSSPAQFQRYADTLNYIMQDRGADPVWNYMDDFFTCSISSPLCNNNLDIMVCHAGRTFMRRLVDLLPTARAPSHHIRLTRQSRKDIDWWASFLPHWNVRQIPPTSTRVRPTPDSHTESGLEELQGIEKIVYTEINPVVGGFQDLQRHFADFGLVKNATGAILHACRTEWLNTLKNSKNGNSKNKLYKWPEIGPITGVLAAVDATLEPALGKRFKVEGYPTGMVNYYLTYVV